MCSTHHIERFKRSIDAPQERIDHLALDETTVTGRDIEMLRSIDQFGSTPKAADELERVLDSERSRIDFPESYRMWGYAEGCVSRRSASVVK